uniref:Uncharacterized protein n=1 Tax=Cacopsylla melanoneura TaxID=428564 RepID=A0A8D9B4N0_9HEMI
MTSILGIKKSTRGGWDTLTPLLIARCILLIFCFGSGSFFVAGSFCARFFSVQFNVEYTVLAIVHFCSVVSFRTERTSVRNEYPKILLSTLCSTIQRYLSLSLSFTIRPRKG